MMKESWFRITQDQRIADAIEPLHVKERIKPEWMQGELLHELEQATLQFTIRPSRSPVAVDLIEQPYPLWSDDLKHVMEAFAPRLLFRVAGLMDLERQKLYPYWFMVPPRIAALAGGSEFDRSGRLRGLQVDGDRLNRTPWPVVQLTDQRLQETVLLVNLALAEAILRREFIGLKLERVELTTWELQR